ncbi:MAG: triose-phosphate isomerase [Alphaproteobacteria bacterium]
MVPQKHAMLVAGNWKMNGDVEQLSTFAKSLKSAGSKACEVLVCPPFPLLGLVSAFNAEHGDGCIQFGAQDCHANTSGAHTGDTSAGLIKSLGCSHVILGHSERRADHGETSDQVRAQAQTAIEAGLTAIVCVGETKDQRESGKAKDVVLAQLKQSLPESATDENTVIAYEPVWAIGTGLVASVADIQQMHADIHAHLAENFASGGKMRILYGGSVKGSNASEIFAVAHVDGALVGGASLKADSFAEIIKAGEEAHASK